MLRYEAGKETGECKVGPGKVELRGRETWAVCVSPTDGKPSVGVAWYNRGTKRMGLWLELGARGRLGCDEAGELAKDQSRGDLVVNDTDFDYCSEQDAGL